MSNVAIQETYDLPSGYGKVTLRAMTTLDEKMRLAGNGMDSIVNLIQNCVVEPKELKVSDLKIADLQFLMYKLRIITYGSDYRVSLRCPECGEQLEVVVNLDDLQVITPPEDFVEPFDIALPVSGDVLQARLLSTTDYNAIEREGKRIKSKQPNYVGDPEFIITYKYKIVSINNEITIPSVVQEYVENM